MDVLQNSSLTETLSRTDLVADLERKIAIRTGGRIRGLHLEEIGGAIVLCGRTTTYYVKQLATQVAMDESHLLTFQNSIEVI